MTFQQIPLNKWIVYAIAAVAMLPDGVFVAFFLLMFVKTEEEARQEKIPNVVGITRKELESLEQYNENTVYLVVPEEQLQR